MSIGQSLSHLALTQLVEDVFSIGGAEGVDAVRDFLARCGQRNSFQLTATLAQGLDRAWRAAEAALTDDPFWRQGRAGLPPGDAQALRDGLEMVLAQLTRGGVQCRTPGATVMETAVRQECLRELRAVRETDALADGLDADEWTRCDEVFRPFSAARDHPQHGMEGELLRALERQGCVALMRLLTASGGLPLLGRPFGPLSARDLIACSAVVCKNGRNKRRPTTPFFSRSFTN